MTLPRAENEENFQQIARRSDGAAGNPRNVPHNKILFLLRFTTIREKTFSKNPRISPQVPQGARIADCVPSAIYDFTEGERAGIHAISPNFKDNSIKF